MNAELENAESIVQIDQLNLDKECVKLPSQYLAFAIAAADVKNRIAELKAELEVIQADLSSDIRGNPAKYGLEKVTEGAISAVILQQQRFQEAQRKLQKAQHRSDLYQSVVWSLEHKKRSLVMLVELHGMGYFADPKLSDRGRKAVEQMTKEKVRPRRHLDED